MAGHVVNPSSKFEDPMAIRSWATSSDISHRIPLTGEGRISGEGGHPLPICWYHSKGNWMLYNSAADSFYIMKLCSRLFVLHYRSRPKYDTFMHFDPHFEEVRGGVESWWMARWKARAEFLLSIIEVLFLSLTVEALQGKTCQNSQLSGVGSHFEPKFQGEGVVPVEYFLVSTTLDTFCYATVQTAPCYVPSFWHNTGVWQTDRRKDRQTDRQTDGRTDGIAIANTALAMRALRAL